MQQRGQEQKETSLANGQNITGANITLTNSQKAQQKKRHDGRKKDIAKVTYYNCNKKGH